MVPGRVTRDGVGDGIGSGAAIWRAAAGAAGLPGLVGLAAGWANQRMEATAASRTMAAVKGSQALARERDGRFIKGWPFG